MQLIYMIYKYFLYIYSLTIKFLDYTLKKAQTSQITKSYILSIKIVLHGIITLHIFLLQSSKTFKVDSCNTVRALTFF